MDTVERSEIHVPLCTLRPLYGVKVFLCTSALSKVISQSLDVWGILAVAFEDMPENDCEKRKSVLVLWECSCSAENIDIVNHCSNLSKISL